MNAPAAANPEQRLFFAEIRRMGVPLYVVISTPGMAAHLLGQVELREDGQDIVYVGQEGSHLHLSWGDIEYFEHAPRSDYDCIVAMGKSGACFSLSPQDPAYRFSSSVLALCRKAAALASQ